MKRILVVGEINVDLILQGAHAFPTPGKEVLVDDVMKVRYPIHLVVVPPPNQGQQTQTK